MGTCVLYRRRWVFAGLTVRERARGLYTFGEHDPLSERFDSINQLLYAYAYIIVLYTSLNGGHRFPRCNQFKKQMRL